LPENTAAAQPGKRGGYIVFGRPSIGEEEIEAVVSVLRSGWIGTGPRAREFEERFAEYVGSRHAVAVASGTASLHLAMLAQDLAPGDEVLTTPLTFVATGNAILHAEAIPVFVDVNRDSMNLAPERLEAAIGPRTRAVLPVHLAGRPCDMDPILEVARRHGLRVIEDAAHAAGAIYRGRKIGSIGDATCFSFYVTKNLTTIEGGMVCTDREEVAAAARIRGLHGLSKDAWARFADEGHEHYEATELGYKYNLTDLQAAIGLVQLSKLEGWLERRRAIWSHYDSCFADLPCRCPLAEAPSSRHARHLYTLLIDPGRCGITRDEFMRTMHQKGIGTGVHYRALHVQPYYRRSFGFRPQDFPVAWEIGEQTVSLPLSADLTDVEVERVVDGVRGILRR
jgi:dTDP-4-amino-4,6-dideoxygalactose transaminase